MSDFFMNVFDEVSDWGSSAIEWLDSAVSSRAPIETGDSEGGGFLEGVGNLAKILGDIGAADMTSSALRQQSSPGPAVQTQRQGTPYGGRSFSASNAKPADLPSARQLEYAWFNRLQKFANMQRNVSFTQGPGVN